MIYNKGKKQLKVSWPSLQQQNLMLVSLALACKDELTRESGVCDVAHWMLRTQPEGLPCSNYHLSSSLSAVCLVWSHFKFIQDQKIRRIKSAAQSLSASCHTIQQRSQGFYSLGSNTQFMNARRANKQD